MVTRYGIGLEKVSTTTMEGAKPVDQRVNTVDMSDVLIRQKIEDDVIVSLR